MSVDRYTFDTNILFYSIDSAEHAKHMIARRLVGMANPNRTPILLQTLGELSNSVSKRRPQLLGRVKDLLSASEEFYEVVASEPADIHAALAAHARNHMQFWDAVLWATARRSGCSLLLTEDLQDGQTLGGVTFRNPFKMSSAELESLTSW